MIQLKSYGWKIDDEIDEASSSIITFGKSGVRDNKPVVYNKYNIADDSDGDSYTSDSSHSGGIPIHRLRPGYKHNLSDSSGPDVGSNDSFHSSRSNTESVGTYFPSQSTTRSKGSPYQIFQMDM
jgi:hypothetical protein